MGSGQFANTSQPNGPSGYFPPQGHASGAAFGAPSGPVNMHLLGRWTQGLLVATGALFGISALVAMNAWSVYGSMVAGNASVFQSISADDSYWFTVLLAYLTMIAAGIVMIVWMYRVWEKLHRLRPAAQQRWNQGWTIAAWFIPFANLVLPKQIIDDFWTSSAPAAPAPGQGVAPLVHWWWATWLLGSAISGVAATLDPYLQGNWHAFYATSMLGGALLAASGVLAFLVVGGLMRRLESLGT